MQAAQDLIQLWTSVLVVLRVLSSFSYISMHSSISDLIVLRSKIPLK